MDYLTQDKLRPQTQFANEIGKLNRASSFLPQITELKGPGKNRNYAKDSNSAPGGHTNFAFSSTNRQQPKSPSILT